VAQGIGPEFKPQYHIKIKIQIELPYNPAIPPLGIYLNESKLAYYRDT
jgi:hypothetical protein